MRKLLRRAIAAALLTAAAAAQADLAWPAIETPPNAHVEQVAGDLVMNGQHSRVSHFAMAGSEDDVLAFYRTQFGARRVENRVGDARAIASRVGDRFVTVRVHSSISGQVDATIIETQIGGGRSHSKVALDTQALLPAGSAVLQTQESDDDHVPALMVMAVNQVGVQANRDALVEQLRSRGFRVVKEDANRIAGRETLALALESPTEDAAITVTDAGRYRALLVQRTRRPQ
jgi:hypothetical protein